MTGYLVLAMQDQHHYVAPDQRCRVSIGQPDGPHVWSVPEAPFTREGGRAAPGGAGRGALFAASGGSLP